MAKEEATAAPDEQEDAEYEEPVDTASAQEIPEDSNTDQDGTTD